MRERWALILGASSGFGEATALALAAAGYNICGVHLDRRQGMAHVDEIKGGIEAHGRERAHGTSVASRKRASANAAMTGKLHKEYWLDIDPERFERYKTMFQWSPLTEQLISPANIKAGHVIVDVGCGPGFVAVELARRVGPHGHVHAVDINRDFVEHAKELVRENGLESRVTVHLINGSELPIATSSIDRVLAVNVMVYVDDPAATYREFRRVLRPGGDFVFTDPMQAESVPEGVLDPVLQRIHLASLGSIAGYRRMAKAAGFRETLVLPLTEQLTRIVADGVAAPRALVEAATRTHTPLFASPLPAPRVIEALARYLAHDELPARALRLRY